MQAEVDQSGRTDQTNKPTVLAVANGVDYSVLISGADKRKILKTLKYHRSTWSKAIISIIVFSTLLYLLLKKYMDKIDLVIIDTEFPGHEPLIKDRVITLCKRQGIFVSKDQIAFRRIGKASPAHRLAWQVYNGLVKPDRILSAESVLNAIGVIK